MRIFNFIYLFLLSLSSNAQSYTSYFTGNTTDTLTNPLGGVCLMGGATENDEAMKWFLTKANGGDILVLRASGSNGYNAYFYSQLGIPINSVESIVFNNASAANDAYIHNKINKAEAIWFAGGDQWNYVSYWRNTAIDSLINLAITTRNIVIGGTSAGMAILGKYYFSAQNGTISSSTALSNPYHLTATVDSTTFLKAPYCHNIITDTHYDNPDRKGRHISFLARIVKDMNGDGKGIACDEYTAVCIEPNGIAKVFGDYPSNDDNAYFIQPNCELAIQTPEQCLSGQVLNWDLSSQAIKVYQVKGTSTGANTFDLNNWLVGNGGVWRRWFVSNGTLVETTSAAPNCGPLTVNQETKEEVLVMNDNGQMHFRCGNPITKLTLFSAEGKIVATEQPSSNQVFIKTESLSSGIYYYRIEGKQSIHKGKILVNH